MAKANTKYPKNKKKKKKKPKMQHQERQGTFSQSGSAIGPELPAENGGAPNTVVSDNLGRAVQS